MKVVKFKAEHMKVLIENGDQPISAYVNDAMLAVLEKDSHTYTALAEDGEVVACAGFVAYWKDRGEVWAIVSLKARRHFVALHRAAKIFLSTAPFRRLEAAVEFDSKNAHRWVKALGFKKEADKLRAYLPGGKDCALYARIA
jgi:hypothetical protein